MPNTHTTLTSLFSDIADAIRAKTGGTDDIVADSFPTEISSIPSGGADITVEPLSVTENGTYTAPTGKAYSPVTVNVQTGGGLPAGIAALAFGMEVGAGGEKTITHGLGVKPDAIFVWSYEQDANSTQIGQVMSMWVNGAGGAYYYDFLSMASYCRSSGNPNATYSNGFISEVNSTSFDAGNSGNQKLVNGVEYYWLAAKFEEAAA